MASVGSHPRNYKNISVTGLPVLDVVEMSRRFLKKLVTTGAPRGAVGVKVFTRISTNGAALARRLLLLYKGVHRTNDISSNATRASCLSIRHRENVSIVTAAASVR